MTNWTEGDVTANGVSIHYHRTGGEGKPALLLLHGITDNGLCWQRVARDLQDRYDIVMTDARGHGKSDRLGEEFSTLLLAADAAGVIRGLGLDKPVVFGHSMGAITAAALAADYPDLVSALLLEDPPLRDSGTFDLPAEFMETQRRQFAALGAMSPEARTAKGAALNPGWDVLEVEPWAQSKIEVDPNVLGYFGSFDRYPWREAFARMRCRGLLITGDPDKMAIVTPQVAREAVALWPGGAVAHIAGAGHCVHRDRYAETMAAIDAFLAALPGEPGAA
jgi:pimeloyl-ACP methyl ester carboxylesterase